MRAAAIGVEYDGVTVGSYVADLLVEDTVLMNVNARLEIMRRANGF